MSSGNLASYKIIKENNLYLMSGGVFVDRSVVLPQVELQQLSLFQTDRHLNDQLFIEQFLLQIFLFFTLSPQMCLIFNSTEINFISSCHFFENYDIFSKRTRQFQDLFLF